MVVSVDDTLWEVLGLHERVHELSDRLVSGDCRRLLITGPPGSGKSVLARQLAATFDLAFSGVSFHARGDETEANRRLYALRCADSETSDAIKPLKAIGRATANLAVGVLTKGEHDASSILEVFDAEAARRKQKVVFLETDEQAILADLQRNTFGARALLVADNLQWWDKDSLSVLNMLLDGRLNETYPFARDLSVIAVLTDSEFQPPIWLGDFHKHIVPSFSDKLCLRYTQSREMQGVLRIFDPDHTVMPETTAVVFEMSGGHLAILDNALSYLRGLQRNPDEAELSTLLHDMFLARLRNLGSLGQFAKSLLDAASLIGTQFEKDEIACIMNSNFGTLAEPIDTCINLGFLEVTGTRISFRHDYIRQFFRGSLGPKEAELRTTFAECLRRLTPGDYVRRAENFAALDDETGAAVFFAVAAIANVRSGRGPYHLISPSARALLTKHRYGELIKVYETCFRALSEGQLKNALRDLLSLSSAHAEPVLAEIEYLRCELELGLRDSQVRQASVGRLASWDEFHSQEFELGIRLLLLRREFLVLEKNKVPARDLDLKIHRLLSARWGFDPTTEALSKALLRSSESLHMPDIALRHVREAVSYFAPDETGVISNPAEYFKCLNNSVALCISNGLYEEALEEAHKALDVIRSYEMVSFPRTDFLESQKLLAEFRLGRLCPEECVVEQKAIIDKARAEDDPFYTHNYLGVYLSMSGDLDEANKIFDALIERMNGAEHFDFNPRYFVSSNRTVARYLSNGDSSAALEAWDDLSDCVSNIPYETRPLLEERHQIMRSIYLDGKDLSAEEIDVYPIATISRPLHPCFAEVGRGFRMPDVQFWPP